MDGDKKALIEMMETIGVGESCQIIRPIINKIAILQIADNIEKYKLTKEALLLLEEHILEDI